MCMTCGRQSLYVYLSELYKYEIISMSEELNVFEGKEGLGDKYDGKSRETAESQGNLRNSIIPLTQMPLW